MTIDRDGYRSASLETWGEVAPNWEARTAWLTRQTAPVIDWLFEKADPGPDADVLEVAGGTGELAFLLKDLVGDGGTVHYTDFAPEMVDVARRRGEAAGIAGVDFRVLDAERMDFEDDSFDLVLCRWGYMLMADPAAALGETKRVLRQDGRLAFAVWGNPLENPWAAVPAGVLIARGHLPPPEPGSPGIFALADADRIRDLVFGAGFGELEVESIEFNFEHSDFEDVWDVLTGLAGPLAKVIEALDDDEFEATRTAVREGSEPFRREDGSYLIPAVSWGVLAG